MEDIESHECTNIAQLQMTWIMMAAVTDVGTLVGFTNIKAAWFLLDRMYKCFAHWPIFGKVGHKWFEHQTS